jgi:hypothetical protein
MGLLCLAAGLLVPAAIAAAPVTSFLHTQGHDISNERGEKILLRGVGLGNWLLPEGYMWKFGNRADRPRRIESVVSELLGPENSKRFWTEFRKNYIAEPDIRRIAELGYNSVRPALNSRLFLSDTGVATGNEEGFALLDNLIRWCKANGLYVVIDMHGAPGGQTGQNIDDSVNDQPKLFIESKYQDQLVALWRTLALRYRAEPAVAGYDLLNEPLPERTGALKEHRAALEPLYERITAAIREVDSRHIIILEGADWANDWTVFTKTFDSNVVYQFHYYCWNNPSVLKTIQSYLDHRDRLNAPVWVGETGERDNAIYWATTEYFEAHNIGWSFWPWKKMETQNTPFSIKAPAGWTDVTAYTNGGKKPSRQVAQAAFDELLVNIRLENCVFLPDVVNAMMRRAPGRIEAENFGHEGQNKSYFVNEPNRPSKNYRLLEPVQVVASQTGARHSEQYVTLKTNEWTAYTISAESPGEYQITAKVRTPQPPAEARLTIGSKTSNAIIVRNAWHELPLGTVTLTQGMNRLTWQVTNGVADLDWIELSPTQSAQSAQPSAKSAP